MLLYCSTRRRTVNSISGRDISHTTKPRSRTGKGSYPGLSKRKSRPAFTGSAPASVGSCSKPGKRSPSARCPPARSACVCRPCGIRFDAMQRTGGCRAQARPPVRNGRQAPAPLASQPSPRRVLCGGCPVMGIPTAISPPYIRDMNLDLSDEEAAALTKELADITGNYLYPFSERIRALKTILAKLGRARGVLPQARSTACWATGMSGGLLRA